MSHTLFIVAVLAANVALSEWLARRTWFRHLGSALLVIAITAIVANAGLIPTYSPEIGVYDKLLGPVGQLAIFWLLLRVNLRDVWKAGGPMVLMFLVGALGTMLGVLAGLALLGGGSAFGELTWALGGMFVGTYIGGSINFNAIALEYGVLRDGVLYTGAAAVDSAYTAVWMALTVALPRLLNRGRRARLHAPEPAAADAEEAESVTALDGAVLLALGCAGVWGSGVLHDWLDRTWQVRVPTVLLLTTLALVLAQSRLIQRLRGIRVLGWLSVMVFLATIGTLCDVGSVRQLGPLGVRLIGFVGVLLAVHGSVVFTVARLLRLDPALAAVASQANIGGSTSALALAHSPGAPGPCAAGHPGRSVGERPGDLPGLLGRGASAIGLNRGMSVAKLFSTIQRMVGDPLPAETV